MKKYSMLFGLFFSGWISAQPVAIILDKMKALYVGVPNEITVVVSDIPQARLVLIPSLRWKVGCDPSIYRSDQELTFKIR